MRLEKRGFFYDDTICTTDEMAMPRRGAVCRNASMRHGERRIEARREYLRLGTGTGPLVSARNRRQVPVRPRVHRRSAKAGVTCFEHASTVSPS